MQSCAELRQLQVGKSLLSKERSADYDPAGRPCSPRGGLEVEGGLRVMSPAKDPSRLATTSLIVSILSLLATAGLGAWTLAIQQKTSAHSRVLNSALVAVT
jgi:hypothetical protein